MAGLCADLKSHLTETWPSCLLAQESKVNMPVFQKPFEKRYALVPRGFGLQRGVRPWGSFPEAL